jgi:catechol 2,3-dioxygenase-like lactoylglutathione lyase family enzyme
MTLLRMDNVGIVVEDMDAAIAFFVELGMELEGRAEVKGPFADQCTGLDGVHCDIAMVRTPDGHSRLELARYRAPAATLRVPINHPPCSVQLCPVEVAMPQRLESNAFNEYQQSA